MIRNQITTRFWLPTGDDICHREQSLGPGIAAQRESAAPTDAERLMATVTKPG